MTATIPQHRTPDDAWCQLSGCESRSGVCSVCAPEPPLSERELAALTVLAGMSSPVGGERLANRMQAAGRETTPAAAHQAGAALARKRLAAKGRDSCTLRVRYEITRTGLAWLSSYRAAGGAS